MGLGVRLGAEGLGLKKRTTRYDLQYVESNLDSGARVFGNLGERTYWNLL